jgi:hypothetical protein
MHVDSARQHVLSRRVDDLAGIFARQALSKRGNLAVLDGNIARVSVGRGCDAAVNDDGVKAHVRACSFAFTLRILC